MNVDRSTHAARERRPVEEALDQLPALRAYAALLFTRLKQIAPIADGAAVLDVGAGTGGFMIACRELGYDCRGVEPWDEARATARELAARLGVRLDLHSGTAEDLPFAGESFNIVHANSVMEHVADVDRAFSEAYRVLRPGGVLWFYTASSLCPSQGEIEGFPLFGWYPDAIKRKIMLWAKETRPELVGFTEAPALNWFTPHRARRIVRRHGFGPIYDRWDLRTPHEGGTLYRLALSAIRASPAGRLMADMIVPDCAYAAIKE